MGISSVRAAAAERLARLDAGFRKDPPGHQHEPFSLGATWRSAGPLRLLILFQALTFWLSVNLVPLLAPDYDLFFHLAHGRWQALHGAIPTDAWFSFLEPRAYLDYYWLFQRLVWELWESFGYYGLIALRGALTTLSLGMLALFLFGGRRSADTPLSGFLVFSLVGAKLVEGFVYSRPFAFSYLCLLAMLWILERRARWLPLLPLIGVAWINLHGVEHPVMLLVIFAYLGDELLATVRRGHVTRDGGRRLRWLLLTLPALLVSPHGFALVSFPFKSTALASLYVIEMQKASAESFATFVLAPANPLATDYSGTLLLFVLALGALVRNLQRRRLQPVHLVLLLGASWLVLQGWRFTSEFALLTLPLLAGGAFPERRGYRPALATLLVVGLAGFLWYDTARTWIGDNRGSYPLAYGNFPYGTAAFLKNVAPAGGKVFNSADPGGFLIWELGERHRIMMDLEVQALFSDDDFFLNRVAQADPVAFQAFADHYHPDWLAFSPDLGKAAAAFLRQSDFVPVAFDDALVLLVDRRQHPELAAQWELKEIDPWRAKLDGDYRLSPAAVAEAERLYALEPRGLRLPALLAQAALGRGDLTAAEKYVDTLIEVCPQNADTWNLASRLALQRRDLEGAAAALAKALKRAEPEHRSRLRGPFGHLLSDLGREEEALQQLQARFRLYQPVPLEDLELQVKLLEKYGPRAEATAARRVLELRQGKPIL